MVASHGYSLIWRVGISQRHFSLFLATVKQTHQLGASNPKPPDFLYFKSQNPCCYHWITFCSSIVYNIGSTNNQNDGGLWTRNRLSRHGPVQHEVHSQTHRKAQISTEDRLPTKLGGHHFRFCQKKKLLLEFLAVVGCR